jgi:isopentenyldiphosphate isomerase
VDSGEDYDTSAVRELGEEIGVRDVKAGPGDPDVRRWFYVRACEETGWEFCWIYRLRHDGPLELDPEEISGGEWIAPEEVTRRIAVRPADYCSSFKLVWARGVELGLTR